MLWAELANCRHKKFCLPILRVASVQSITIYENLIEIKVKVTLQASKLVFGLHRLTYAKLNLPSFLLSMWGMEAAQC